MSGIRSETSALKISDMLSDERRCGTWLRPQTLKKQQRKHQTILTLAPLAEVSLASYLISLFLLSVFVRKNQMR